MNCLIWSFNDNGNISERSSDTAFIEDLSENQIQFENGNTHLDISLQGSPVILSFEDGFLSLGYSEDCFKVWCKYVNGNFYFAVWYIYKGVYNGMFGMARDATSKTQISGRNFMKFIIENPNPIDKYLKNTVFNNLAMKDYRK